MADIRIVNAGQNNGPIVAANVRALTRANALLVAQVNVSGDIVNPGAGGSGGDGAINDGVDSGIKATVRSTSGAKPLHVIITNASGDMPNLAPPGGADGAITDGDTPAVKATVKDYAASNPLAVVLVNVSGDVYNALGAAAGGDGALLDGVSSSIRATVKDYAASKPLAVVLVNVSGDVYNTGGGAGGDGAINDGAVSSTKASVLLGPTTRPTGTSNPLVVQFADDPTRQIGQISPPVTGVQVLGGSIGARVQPSGDFPVTQAGAWSMAITGDVLLRAGQTLQTSQQGVVGVQVLGGQVGGKVGVSGDVTVIATDLDVRNLNPAQDSIRVDGGIIGISGDVLLRVGPTIPVSQQGVVGVQIVGGSVGARIQPSGDFPVTQSGAWATAVTGDVTTVPKAGETWPVSISGTVPVAEQAKTGVHVASGTLGVSGDVQARQVGAWAVAVTGDVLLRAGGPTIPVTQQGVVGVQIVGGSGGGTMGISGDVTTVPKAGQTWTVREQGVVGVQVVGGQSGGAHGVSGDVSVIPSTTTGTGRFPVSGDTAIRDGVDGAIRSTVRDYTNSNPLTVVLTNPSGDSYLPTPEEPIVKTIPFRITSAGTTTIAGPYNGRVIKVCAYDFQAEADNAGTTQARFGSNASGDALTHQWMLNPREGISKGVSPLGGGYLFKTNLNHSLVVENAGANLRGSVSFHTGDSL